MTGDNNTPQPQWPPKKTTSTEPTPKRKTRAEAPSTQAQNISKALRQAERSAVGSAPVEVAPAAAVSDTALSQQVAAQGAHLPDFGNGNIFGEAFATLLNQVEAAKQHERELEQRAAQAALARTLADKVPAASGAVAAEPAALVQASTPTDFAAQMQALKQAQAAQPSERPQTVQPAVPEQAAVHPPLRPLELEQPESVQPTDIEAFGYVPAAQASAQQPAYRAPAPNGPVSSHASAPLVSELSYGEARSASTSYSEEQRPELRFIAEPAPASPALTTFAPATLNDVPPEVLAQAPMAAPDHLGDQLAHTFSIPSSMQRLRPRFEATGPFLARFLPEVASTHTGIQAGFCNLHDFLGFLHEQNWYGYLHAALGEQSAYVLVYEGRTVAAACLSSTGEQALGELLHLYEQGARLSAYPLESHLAHILSGVGSRAWKFNLTNDFTGLHAKPDEAAYYYQGRVVATIPTGLPYEGAFPAPLRPQTLVLPRSLAGWAHHSYVATLRGRDALNAITPAHQAFKAKFGAAGLGLQAALLEGLTPAEYALRHDAPLHELEPVVHELVLLGYLKDE